MDARYSSQNDDFSWFENLYDQVLQRFPARGRILDAGCGTAILLRRVRTKFPELELCGIDWSSVAVERTRHYGFSAKRAVLPDIPYPDEHFDCVVCTEVLEHSDDPLGILKSFSRVLRTGGTVIVSVPFGMGPDQCNEHVQDFTEALLREYLRKAGFEVKSVGLIVRDLERNDGESFLAYAMKV